MKYSYRRSKINSKIEKNMKKIRKFEWKHRNIILLFASFILAYFILKHKPILSFINNLNYLGYLAALILGMLFSYALTTPPAIVALYNLGQQFNPFLIAFIGAFGSVISDYLIFRFVRDKLMNEINLLSEEIDGLTKKISPNGISTQEIRIKIWKKVSHSNIWKNLIPIIAGLIIASPLPDELGVAIFGAAKYEPKKFIIFSYFMNFFGILAITLLSRIL